MMRYDSSVSAKDITRAGFSVLYCDRINTIGASRFAPIAACPLSFAETADMVHVGANYFAASCPPREGRGLSAFGGAA